jgi:hypothetical protein
MPDPAHPPPEIHVFPMPALTTSKRELAADAPSPGLSQAERIAAAHVARRLCVELQGVMALLPKNQRSASAMARALGIDRNTCQRLVASTATDNADERMLVRLPGIQGLRQFLRAVGSTHSNPATLETLAAAGAAIDAFEQLIDRVAGSQRKLKHRLEADPDPVDGSLRGPSDDLNARRALFKSAAEVVGRWSDVILSMSVIRPVPGHPELTETMRVQGRLGHMWRASAVPLEINAASPDHLALHTPTDAHGRVSVPTESVRHHQSLGSRPASGDTPDLLLTDFCTRPLPRVTSKNWGNRSIHVIDAAESADARPVDIVVGYRRSTPDKHPATQDPPIGEVSSILTYPSRRLISDVYLHRDIASRCIPSLELHLGSPTLGQPLRARWSTRFPGGPRLELLGSGLSHSASIAYDRHLELTTHAFRQVGWDPTEFIGYRCDVVFPIWQAAYCMLFDFSGNAMAEASGTPQPAGTPRKRGPR